MNLEQFAQLIRDNANGALTNVSTLVVISMAVVAALLLVVSVIALIVSICLAIAYAKYNRKENSLKMTGQDIARRVLDQNGLSQIKVSSSGSMLFGNSYSHFFKKVRLRRLTWKKASVSSMAMAVQKSSLAVLDKEGDSDMKKRVRLTPLIYLGPWAFIPLVAVGVLLDVVILPSSNGTYTMLFSMLGVLFYVLSFVMSILVMKTEKKAQQKALELMERDGLATGEEITLCKKLFKLYNIEYINNMIIALLEMIYQVLQIIAYVQNGSFSSSAKN